MTGREKLINGLIREGCCPQDYGMEIDWDECGESDCETCWKNALEKEYDE